MVAEGGCPLSQGHYFGVGGRVGIEAVAVEAAAHNPAFANQHCPYRDLAGLQGKLGLLEGLFHPEFIRSSIHAPKLSGNCKCVWPQSFTRQNFSNIFSGQANPCFVVRF